MPRHYTFIPHNVLSLFIDSFIIPFQGRADDNVDFSSLPEALKQCVYRRSGNNNAILVEVNKCSKSAGGANCLKNIPGLSSCFE